MVGLYEGRTTDTGAACVFRYGSDGVAVYSTSTRSLRITPDLTSSGSVFEKTLTGNGAGFAITWSIGIDSGHEADLSYQVAAEPASANGLLIRPAEAGMPACLITAAPAPDTTGGASTVNLLGRTWQPPQVVNGDSGSVANLPDQAGFDTGMAEDGHAFVTFRQADANGRLGVYVVEGMPGAAGASPTWTAPRQLDAAAPLLAGTFRPRVAVSSNGHAVVAWLSEQPCEADAYESSPAGKTCRYLYASRRLATAEAWEAPMRVRASPPMAAQDHYARINARGDIVLVFPGFVRLSDSLTITAPMLAVRSAADAAYRPVQLYGFWSNSVDAMPFAQRILVSLDESGGVFVAGQASGALDGLAHAVSTLSAMPDVLRGEVVHDPGMYAYELQVSGGLAAYTWKQDGGAYDPRRPERLTLYSPATGGWSAGDDIGPFAVWGATTLIGTDAVDGEFLLYSGCRLTTWHGGSWGATRTLPTYCGLDHAGGVYAFNRHGDYLGLNWAGVPGQWGYYERRDNQMLKGAPGSASANSGDYVLGTPSDAIGTAPTQLLLANNGIALALATTTYASLPSAANPSGVAGSGTVKLWAVYLK